MSTSGSCFVLALSICFAGSVAAQGPPQAVTSSPPGQVPIDDLRKVLDDQRALIDRQAARLEAQEASWRRCASASTRSAPWRWVRATPWRS